MNTYEIAAAIIASRELTAHGRRHKILSAIAAVLADDEYDDVPLEDLLSACEDHGIALDYGLSVSFPSSACTVCLAATPFRVSICPRCKAAGHRSALMDDAVRPAQCPGEKPPCPDCGGAFVWGTCADCGMAWEDVEAAAEMYERIAG